MDISQVGIRMMAPDSDGEHRDDGRGDGAEGHQRDRTS
jgi:hypothetical protein